MAALKLSDAVSQVRQYVDDESSSRWTSAQVNRALQRALDACLLRYAHMGGDRFDQEAVLTTDVADGGVNIGAFKVLKIRGVAITVDPTTYMIPPKGGMRRGYADLVSRTLRMLYVREYELPTDTSHPLVGIGGIDAPTFTLFDDWVCAEAAAQLLIKDDNQRMSLEQLRVDITEDIRIRGTNPNTWPMMRREWSPVIDQLNWQFVPGTKRLYTIRVAW